MEVNDSYDASFVESAGTDPYAGRVDSQISHLVKDLDDVYAPEARGEEVRHEDRLVHARLGIASSLFTSLRCRHAGSAAHCLRVALGCSSWALALKLPAESCDHIELAAMLHDVGKIGVPDGVLLKPGKLSASEISIMDRHRMMGLEILAGVCLSKEVINIVRYAPAWYDGNHGNFDLTGPELPLGARMLAIVDAFDSMTTDSVYRRALSRERALSELFNHAGTQFDPDLVKQFCKLYDTDQLRIHTKVARRWLSQLDTRSANSLWGYQPSPATAAATASGESVFHQKLLENMRDGVAFVDSNAQIVHWNRGMERLTGIASNSVFQRSWAPSLFDLRDERGSRIKDKDCPARYVIASGVQSLRRAYLTRTNNTEVAVDIQVVPVISETGTTEGATIIVHDVSNVNSLEEQCQSLHEMATRDPLTQVANRAEFDRVHAEFVETHLSKEAPCSMMICDIDHFKSVNDVYGHQAGDEAIQTLAQLLKRMCRPGDLVARYGGEEFVMLCADCNNATCYERADTIRKALADLPLSMLEGKQITASFGVTEVQPGDSPETMLNRADRALLAAKDGGRNMVVQLGSGADGGDKHDTWWSRWKNRSKPNQLIEKLLITPVPLKVAVEKLRGFVADHHAKIDSIDGNTIVLRIDPDANTLWRRATDRPTGFTIELEMSEEQLTNQEDLGKGISPVRTSVQVTIRPKKDRDRRKSTAQNHARHLLASIRSYLMATEASHLEQTNVLRRATSLVASWLTS